MFGTHISCITRIKTVLIESGRCFKFQDFVYKRVRSMFCRTLSVKGEMQSSHHKMIFASTYVCFCSPSSSCSYSRLNWRFVQKVALSASYSWGSWLQWRALSLMRWLTSWSAWNKICWVVKYIMSSKRSQMLQSCTKKRGDSVCSLLIFQNYFLFKNIEVNKGKNS